ncbi:hypothetical protein NEOLEDRAFT_1183248 [Neolentinus lepideus HHB14362 ss-1]|uniref:Uncharacterized protein n=1 Tax=Neolentinus lepideus HHB14362 ss-1 TaxID=1314782 RepID=A0A165NGQ6_9AGAM|nr:hypothetical protein NEOLEDRAFT_1183248 [Neolentinus lepideus HHB14362 ss-1]
MNCPQFASHCSFIPTVALRSNLPTLAAAWEWEYMALCLELLPASVVVELHRPLPVLPWALVVMLPSVEEAPLVQEEVPPVQEEEEVIAPVTTCLTKGKGKGKVTVAEKPQTGKVTHPHAKQVSRQIEVGLPNERQPVL